jgi:hypothetical protein
MTNTMKSAGFIALASLAGGTSALAHLSYTGRDFGTLNPGNETVSTTKAGSISSTFGWAYSTDYDLGDSHRNRAFRFSLANEGDVTITAQATGVGNPLLPAFSIYSGLAHLPPAALDHDGSVISVAYLTGLFGAPDVAQGAFNALGDWQIGNDDGVNSSLSYLAYRGNAADGTSANFGTASGINGDGTADGFVTGTFHLAAGNYTIMVGGAQYLTTPPTLALGETYPTYATSVTVSVVPEPTAPLLGALSLLGLLIRRRRA